MTWHCHYCRGSLRGGDIYQVLKEENPSKTEEELLAMASALGWTSSNKKRFKKAEIYEDKIRCSRCHCVTPR
jgi:hypothetical protein